MQRFPAGRGQSLHKRQGSAFRSQAQRGMAKITVQGVVSEVEKREE